MESQFPKYKIDGIPEWSPLYGKEFTSPRNVRNRRFRNREATEKHIFDVLVAIAHKGGIYTLTINKLAREAKVSKALIYRYYGGLNQLISVYVQRTTQNLNDESVLQVPKCETVDQLREAIKQIYRARMALFYKSRDRRVIMWKHLFESLSGQTERAAIRRPTSIMLKNAMVNFPMVTEKQIDAFDAMISATHMGLVAYRDCLKSFNDIDLNDAEQWEGIQQSVSEYIDFWIDKYIVGAGSGQGASAGTA